MGKRTRFVRIGTGTQVGAAPLERSEGRDGIDVVETLKVSASSNPNSVAGALAGALRRHHVAIVTVVGAGALNQSIKAVAIARNHVRDDGIDLVCIPAFTEVDIDGSTRTAIVLRVEHRPALIDLRIPQVEQVGPS